jgi:hypothetical protein
MEISLLVTETVQEDEEHATLLLISSGEEFRGLNTDILLAHGQTFSEYAQGRPRAFVRRLLGWAAGQALMAHICSPPGEDDSFPPFAAGTPEAIDLDRTTVHLGYYVVPEGFSWWRPRTHAEHARLFAQIKDYARPVFSLVVQPPKKRLKTA